jgi:hypothetical protein
MGNQPSRPESLLGDLPDVVYKDSLGECTRFRCQPRGARGAEAALRPRSPLTARAAGRPPPQGAAASSSRRCACTTREGWWW